MYSGKELYHKKDIAPGLNGGQHAVAGHEVLLLSCHQSVRVCIQVRPVPGNNSTESGPRKKMEGSLKDADTKGCCAHGRMTEEVRLIAFTRTWLLIGRQNGAKKE